LNFFEKEPHFFPFIVVFYRGDRRDIATTDGHGLTLIFALCHCEEQRDEAISPIKIRIRQSKIVNFIAFPLTFHPFPL
jgi:hypothetical protein